jgi:hypothetical protein
MSAESLVVAAIMSLQGFKEWLVVNNVMFSYCSFFSREVLRKRRGLNTSRGASLSL